MLDEPLSSDWTGRLIDGRFALLQRLGESAQGFVYLTELRGSGSLKAAIKLIPAMDGAPALLERWQAISALSHPHLMHLLHCGRCQIAGSGYLYLVTEYAEETLANVLLERPLTPDEASEMLLPALSALGYLHQSGFVHAHLTPSNIFVVDDQLRLSTDYLLPIGTTQQRQLDIHQAPESGAGPLAPPADVWSLGITLVEALTQQLPLWERPLDADPLVPETIPQPLAAIARACLSTNPQRRATVAELTARLDRALPLPPPPPRAKPPRRQLSILTYALAAAAIVVLLFIAALWFDLSRRPRPAAIAESQPMQSEPRPAAPQPISATKAVPPLAVAKPQSPAPVAAPVHRAPQPVSSSQLPSPSRPANPFQPGSVALRVQPQVPAKAMQTIQGEVNLTVRLSVDASGSVAGADLPVPGPSRYFAGFALDAAKDWKFAPPRVAGRAVPSTWTLQFQFRQDAVQIVPTQIAPAPPASPQLAP